MITLYWKRNTKSRLPLIRFLPWKVLYYGSVEWRLQERLFQTLKGISARSKDLSSISEKSPVEIDHTEETLNARLNRGLRKL